MIRLVAVIWLVLGVFLAFAAVLAIVGSTRSLNTVAVLSVAAVYGLFAVACLLVGARLLQTPSRTMLTASAGLGALLALGAAAWAVLSVEGGAVIFAAVAALSATAGILALAARNSVGTGGAD